jgi:hypothetical protein
MLIYNNRRFLTDFYSLKFNIEIAKGTGRLAEL